jgi:hypothetical protein
MPDSPPLCPSCGQPAGTGLSGADQGWECRNEACPEYGQPLQPDEPPPVDPPDPGDGTAGRKP